MGLLLCTKDAKHPLYYEKLDIDIWSIQELCYVIYHYPVMIPEDFVDKKLINWIRDELALGIFAARLEQLLASGEPQENLLTTILLEGNYYTGGEVSHYKSELKRLRSIEYPAFAELLGDTFFQMGRFGKAVKAYQDAMEDRDNAAVAEKLATAYVRVMQFEQAAALYEGLYQKTGADRVLQKLYYISRLEPSIDVFHRYKDKTEEDQLSAWEQAFEEVRGQVEASDRVKRINEMFEEDPKACREQAARLIKMWKREYREKV